jgi:MFS transporter, UMF1 family
MKKYSKKIQNGWAFYDWANSVYPLVITSAIFPIFYESLTNGDDGNTVTFFGYEFINTSLISFVSAASFLFISSFLPLLSGIADYMGNKKRFLQFFCYLGATSCMSLAFFNVENLELSLFAFFMASVGFWSSLVFYNAYLPEIAPVEEHDKLSAKGFSLGYLGSSSLLIICLILVLSASTKEAAFFNMRLSFVMTGLWWIGFSQITYSRLPKTPKKGHEKNIIWKGYRELKNVWRELKHTKRLKRYLGAFFVYSMAVQTIMIMAVYFGSQEISWPDKDAARGGLITSVLLIQFIAILGAFLLSRFSAIMGNLKALMLVVFLWICICIGALWVYTPTHFYITAAAVGLVMGGIQALSRSTYSKFLPETKDTTSYFSFYDIAEKLGIVIGTFSYGFIQQITGSMRNSIFALIVFFVVGFILLLRVPKEEVVNSELRVKK